jgi:hypothetical protein
MADKLLCIEHGAHIVEICNIYRILVKKYLGYWPLEKLRWEDNINMDQNYVKHWDLLTAILTISVLLLGTW